MSIEQNYKDEPALADFELSLLNVTQFIILVLFRLYQKTISRALPSNTCRFYPSCSHYGYQSVYKYGAIKGTIMTVYRVLRCNPFNPGGFDPVP